MNEMPLEFYIKNIDEALTRTHAAFNEATTEQYTELKISAYCEIIGELSGELAFVKESLEKEMKNRKSKKFWQFWK